MGFSRKRGRPRSESREETDRGTPELQRRRRYQLTAEPIDRLAQANIINANEHWCALHFRWLYTLRYGTATVASVDPAQVKGRLNKKFYSEWQQEREEEWKEAVAVLEAKGLYRILCDICIYHFPLTCDRDQQQLLTALAELCSLWCRRNESR